MLDSLEAQRGGRAFEEVAFAGEAVEVSGGAEGWERGGGRRYRREEEGSGEGER